MVKVHPHLPELPLAEPAWEWLRGYGVTIEVQDPLRTTGGGYWHPDTHRVELFTAQEEAAIHELAHAWYEERRKKPAWRKAFLAAVKRLSEEPDPAFRQMAQLAHVYEHGDPAIGFPGMKDNDAERYAGLASGCMGRLGLLPGYVRAFYEGLFED